MATRQLQDKEIATQCSTATEPAFAYLIDGRIILRVGQLESAGCYGVSVSSLLSLAQGDTATTLSLPLTIVAVPGPPCPPRCRLESLALHSHPLSLSLLPPGAQCATAVSTICLASRGRATSEPVGSAQSASLFIRLRLVDAFGNPTSNIVERSDTDPFDVERTTRRGERGQEDEGQEEEEEVEEVLRADLLVGRTDGEYRKIDEGWNDRGGVEREGQSEVVDSLGVAYDVRPFRLVALPATASAVGATHSLFVPVNTANAPQLALRIWAPSVGRRNPMSPWLALLPGTPIRLLLADTPPLLTSKSLTAPPPPPLVLPIRWGPITSVVVRPTSLTFPASRSLAGSLAQALSASASSTLVLSFGEGDWSVARVADCAVRLRLDKAAWRPAHARKEGEADGPAGGHLIIFATAEATQLFLDTLDVLLHLHEAEPTTGRSLRSPSACWAKRARRLFVDSLPEPSVDAATLHGPARPTHHDAAAGTNTGIGFLVQLAKAPVHHLLTVKTLYGRVDGELAVGPGVLRELVDTAMREVVEAKLLVETVPPGSLAMPAETPTALSYGTTLAVYRGLGRLAALSILVRLDAPRDWPTTLHHRFAPPVLRALVGDPLSLASVADVDAPFASGFVHYLRQTPVSEWEEVVGSTLRWTTEVGSAGTESRSLRWFGSWQRVGEASKREYLSRFIRSRMEEVPAPYVRAMRQGLCDVLPSFDDARLHWVALGELISGPIVGAVTGADIAEAATIRTTSASLDARFRAILCDLTDDEAAALLQFATGTRVPPAAGLSSLAPPLVFTFPPVGPRDRLPTAATCFHTVLITPPHHTSSIVTRLRTALAFGSRGFAFV